MLILTRGLGQKIIIGNKDIDVTILSVKGNQVRVGINAESNVSIHREEVFERIKEGTETVQVNIGKKLIESFKSRNRKI